MKRSFLLPVLCLLVTLYSGCSGRQPVSELSSPDRERLLLIDRELPGDSCSAVNADDEPPPPVDEVFDPQALSHALEQAGGAEGDFLLLSVRLMDRSVDRLAALAGNLDGDVQEDLVDELRSALQPIPDIDAWTGRMRIDFGAEPEVRLGISTGCRPEMLNKDEAAQALSRLTRGVPVSAFPMTRDSEGNQVPGPLTLLAHFRISEEGRVVESRVERSSGHSEVDRAALQIAPMLRFTPALQDGIPTVAWVAIPLQVVLHSPRRSSRPGQNR